MKSHFEPGSEFSNRFQILEQAGKGGTAAVFKAYDKASGSIVALKIFGASRKSRNQDPAILQEIHHRESTALAKLQHPNIVEFVDAGRDDITSLNYIALEWVDGTTLEEDLESLGALSWEDFQDRYGEPVLSALITAFEDNIIHRDVSTGNIIVDKNGLPKIIDFGQAKLTEFSLGRTVAAFATKPYCPPEDDTGTYTRTRDPYSFSAIAVRALVGRPLTNHDELYSELEHVTPPPHIKATLLKALDRDPRARFENIESFHAELHGTRQFADPEVSSFSLAIRIAPGVEAQLDEMIEPDDVPIDRVLNELEEAFAIYPLDNNDGGLRFGLETQSFRLVVAVDSGSQDHLVVVGASQKLFQLDSLYGSDRWQPDVSFTKLRPIPRASRDSTKRHLASFFAAFESFLTTTRQRTKSDIYDEWKNLLEALRHIEKRRSPPVEYREPEVEGRRLTVVVHSWGNLLVGELRTIIDGNGTWLFRGEVEEIKGPKVTLYSNWPRIDAQSIPVSGALQSDWQQARIALERQERALDQFRNSEVANRRLSSLITLEEKGGQEPEFRAGTSFFDKTLDSDKKTLIAQFLSIPDLMVIHGPPGTGKTTLIVEAIRQIRAENPKAKILLASQTHVALDNVLEKFIEIEPAALITRIGSGNRDLDSSVAECSIEKQAEALKKESEQQTRMFLKKRAEELCVDFSEVSLGLRALEVLAKRNAENELHLELQELEDELESLTRQDEEDRETSTTEKDANRTALRSIEEEILEKRTQTKLVHDEVSAALQLLEQEGQDGKDLAQQDQQSLKDWCSILLNGSEEQKIKRLLELAEEWRLKFAASAEVNAAVIARSEIIAGTCVGFCREPSSYEIEFDACIVDEASKATTTELLVPLSRSRKTLLVGDHHQLPAVVDTAISSSEILERFNLTESTIERQLFEVLQDELGDAHKGFLTTQYRMHPLIGQLVSECFYEGALQSADGTKNRAAADLALAGISTPVTWVNTKHGRRKPHEERRGTSFANSHEVECIINILRRISFVLANQKVVQTPKIGVISGYAAQVESIGREISRDTSLHDLKISCDTVHAFQGREVDICIYSIVRSNANGDIGFLREWRHLNVALSRARDNLIIVGDFEFSRSAKHPNPLVLVTDFVTRHNECAVQVWNGS